MLGNKKEPTADKCHMDEPQKPMLGTSLAVQWLRLWAAKAGGTGSIPGRGTKISHAARRGKKKKKIRQKSLC